MWCTAAGTTLFASVLSCRWNGRTDGTVFLKNLGILTTFLLFDDLFMVHEIIFPDILHLSELWVYFSYFACMAYILLKSHRFILRETEFKLLVMAGIAFGASIAMDTNVLPGGNDVEDTFKLFGLSTYTYYCVISAARLLKTHCYCLDDSQE